MADHFGEGEIGLGQGDVTPDRVGDAMRRAVAFGDQADIVTIMDGDEAIASVMNFYFRDQVLPYYGGGRFIARDRYGNDLRVVWKHYIVHRDRAQVA
ncbi:MAG TPA: hypothetical protein PKD47_09550, partial [Solirubrobacterales bacterium]|nr:hypothetical protein [Solirubrobacterales bacterium]